MSRASERTEARLEKAAPAGSLGVIFLTVALDLVGFGMVVPLLPLYAERFVVSPTRIALLLAAYSLMQFCFAPLWGAYSDRVGRRPVLLFSIAMGVVSNTIFAAAPSYGVLLVARLFAGIATANLAVASAYVADVTGPSGRARGMGLLGAAFGLGFILGPALGGELSLWGTGAPAWAAAGLGAVNFIWAWFRLPESHSVKDRPRVAVPTSGWRARLDGFRGAKPVAPLLAAGFLQIFGFAMLEMSLSLFAAHAVGLDARHCGRLFAFVGVVLTLVQGALIGPLSRRLGELPVAAVGFLALSIGMSGLTTVGLGQIVPLALWLTWVALGQGLLSPALSAAISRRTEAHRQGATLGVHQSLGALGRATGPQIAGLLIARGDLATPFWAGSLVCLGGMVTVLGALRQRVEPRQMGAVHDPVC